MAQAQRAAEAQSMKALQDRREQTRQQFFKGRQDVDTGRLDRRQIQADLVEKFKREQMKPVSGASNLLQRVDPTGMGLAQYTQDVARKYGPTPREIAGDIGYGIRSIGSALGERIASGNFGIIGIAKNLYEQFTNRAAQAKDALVKGVNKLSDIDLEILKNKDQYKFLSKKPEIQEVETLQNTQMTEFDKANIIRQNIEQLETAPVTQTTTLPQQPPGFKVMPTGYPTYDPNKSYLQQQDDYYYQGKPQYSPTGNQYLYAAEGGSVDSKLNDLQKKTNNIYGTGILSVR
jgi:hypothetical protein